MCRSKATRMMAVALCAHVIAVHHCVLVVRVRAIVRALSFEHARILPACIRSRTTSASIRAQRTAFLQALQARKYTVVAFAPGACRWSAQRQPIPGGNDASMSLPNARTHARARARAYTSLSPKMLVCPLLHFLLCVCVCVCVCARTPL